MQNKTFGRGDVSDAGGPEPVGRSPLAPLLALVTAIDEADLLDVGLPLEMPELLERFLDPEVQEALPDGLRAVAAAYLAGLPGHRAGDFGRAEDAHRALLDLWNGEAQVVSEGDILELGLEADDG